MRRSLLAPAFGLLAIATTASATPVQTHYTLVRSQARTAAHATSNASSKNKKEKTRSTVKDGAAQGTIVTATKPTKH